MASLKEKLRQDYDRMVQDTVEEQVGDQAIRNEVVDNLLKELPELPTETVPFPSTMKVSGKGFTPKSRKPHMTEAFLAQKAAELGKSVEEMGLKPTGSSRKKAGSYPTWEGDRRMANRLVSGGKRLVTPHISSLGKRPGFEASLFQIGEEGGNIKGGARLEKAAEGEVEKGRVGKEAAAVEGMTPEEAGEGVRFGFTPPDPFRKSSLSRFLETRTKHSEEVTQMMALYNESAKEVHRTQGQAAPQLAKGPRKPPNIPKPAKSYRTSCGRTHDSNRAG